MNNDQAVAVENIHVLNFIKEVKKSLPSYGMSIPTEGEMMAIFDEPVVAELLYHQGSVYRLDPNSDLTDKIDPEVAEWSIANIYPVFDLIRQKIHFIPVPDFHSSPNDEGLLDSLDDLLTEAQYAKVQFEYDASSNQFKSVKTPMGKEELILKNELLDTYTADGLLNQHFLGRMIYNEHHPLLRGHSIPKHFELAKE